MKYPIMSNAVIDVTKPPYCADNTGKTDCTKILIQILDDILIHQVEELQKTYDKLVSMSNHLQEDAYIGIEAGRVEDGKLVMTFAEHEPASRIIYFPKGTYLVHDTITYSLENLKQLWYSVPNYENNRNIHFIGEDKENTIIRLADASQGFGEGQEKPLISFVNHALYQKREDEYTNVAFMNTIEDITLDCGRNNPGAIGIKYVSSNCGRIENVNIRTEAGTCGIFVDNTTTQAVFTSIGIEGFDYGLDVERTAHLILDEIDVSKTKIAGIFTNSSSMLCNRILSGDIPAICFKPFDGQFIGRYYFTDSDITFANENPGHFLQFEAEASELRKQGIPKNQRSENPEDYAFVDDFGAKGDGVTDSTRAIQKAMNSGKSVILFGAGEYYIDGKIKIPKTVKTVDFMFCSLACGTRLVGGEYDAAFEVSEDSEELLFVENLSAWERLKGHMRLVKHAAKRDIVLSDIHLMCAALYFNCVSGSKVYLDNCFLTMGTYVRTAWIPGKEFVPAYCRILPYEFHGQQVYGRVVNPERADVAMLNDNSEILLDGFRTEGCGTALKAINGGSTRITMFNAGIGCKEAENPLFESYASNLSLSLAIAFGFDTETEYHIVITEEKNGVQKSLVWDELETDFGAHGKILENFKIEA